MSDVSSMHGSIKNKGVLSAERERGIYAFRVLIMLIFH